MPHPAPEKPERLELPPPLKTRKEVRTHTERERALRAQAKREKEEKEVESQRIANEQQSFVLRRNKIYLGVELALIVFVLSVVIFLLLKDQLALGVSLLSSSSVGGALFLWNRSKTDS